MKHHLLIAGTGRAGTSLLVRYLTELGLDTHLSKRREKAGWYEDANAGLEDTLLRGGDDLPYLIKSPWLFQSIDEILASDQIKVDGVIIPVRDLAETASSRTILELQEIHSKNPWFAEEAAPWQAWATTPGGALYSLNPLDQARLLAVGFHHLVERLVTAQVPTYFLAFPRLTEEPEYLYRALKGCLPPSVTEQMAIKAHSQLVDGQKVRVTKEIGGGHHQRGLVSPEAVPSLEKVDNLALRREITKLRKEQAKAVALSNETRRNLENDIQVLNEALALAQHQASYQAKIAVGQDENINALRSELLAYQSKINALYSSSSWRLTGPIRRIVQSAIGRGKKGS